MSSMSTSRPNRARRTERDNRISAAVRRGEPLEAIAVREGLSPRHVRRIKATLSATTDREMEGVEWHELDPFAEVAAAVTTHRWAIRELRRIAERTANDAARVGAVKAAPTIAAALIDLLSGVGLFPAQPVDWWSENEWRAGWQSVFETCKAAGIDLETFVHDVEQRLEDTLGARRSIRVVGVDAITPAAT